MCWPLRRHRPALRRDDLFLAKGVGPLGAVEDAAAVDPGAEIGRDRDVGRGRDDAPRQLAVAGGDVAQQPAERFLGRLALAARHRQARRHRDRRRRRAGAPPARPAAPRSRNAESRSAGRSSPANSSHSAPSGTAMPRWNAAIWSGFISPAWLSLCPAKGSPIALDRVGDEAGRPVVGDGVEGVEHRLHVVAAEIGHQPLQRRRRRARRGSRGCRDSG